MSIEIIQGNALDLSIIGNKSYDIVLCFEPLYHLSKMEDRCCEKPEFLGASNHLLFIAKK